MSQRNMVHDMWGVGPDGEPQRLASRWGKHQIEVAPMTVEQVEAVDQQLVDCASQLNRAIIAAFGPVRASIETQLRWEEHLRSLPPSDVEAMVRRRATDAGMSADEVDAAARQAQAGYGQIAGA